ncbi:hypothetical protein ACFQMA_16525 [Halosimplex aquaticum]|uniref:Uncharacterized protein n=1 Tax=Halosimplex aquaticum TaxID=3026162 RepID=A0ABD5Y6X2_9EURY|nr:hypothetical protein [Halosimplex aquaticum]
MSTRRSVDGAAGRAEGGLPDAVPVSPERTTRLSWELGERLTRGADAALSGRWECVTAPWELAVFDVADHTALVRVRTPVGRELFYETAADAIDAARARLADAPDWELRD